MDNYTGPYWSDGKFQESVQFGATAPLTDLDRASRLHDSAYAKFKDESHRIAADIIYQDTLKTIDSASARLIRGLPVYGNYTKNRAYEYGEALASGMKFGGLPGAVGGLAVAAVRNVFRQNDLLINLDKYKAEVRDYYATDPYKDTHQSYALEVNDQKKSIPIKHPTKTPQKFDAVEAPQQKPEKLENPSEMRFGKTKIAPEQPAHAAPNAVRPQAAQPYRPLRKKRVAPTAADVMLYLKYHPDQLQAVSVWLDKHPEVLHPTAQHKR
jgi:hypothetical protein